ncbi:EAL domain-containing protein [Caldinitratiruptor microaerophilus]|uniref:EAL domain-containing protein n=1 Tax=Caldinitratiruptor microaerophilus TaxID=671077 RepID=UPI00222F6159|nr:EAL domain-containing protein [Caldinitratiruptor microaerophilus]
MEITESAAITDIQAARRFVRSLKLLGLQVASDDFGVGFSSIQHLKHLPADLLKIDGSFRYLTRDAVDRHLVRTLAEAAKRLGLETMAEFVEDGETVRLLKEYGVRYGQGYYFGRPRPVSEVLGDAVPRN